jgi:hypothetical protein
MGVAPPFSEKPLHCLALPQMEPLHDRVLIKPFEEEAVRDAASGSIITDSWHLYGFL